MQYWESAERAREIRARAETLMDERGVAPTPANYELWFFYALGHDQDLCRALNAAVESGQATDPVRAKEIHTRFFVRADERVEKAEAQLNTQLTELSSALVTAGGGVAAFGRTLEAAGAQLALAESPSDLKRLIDDTARATAQMDQHNRTLEAQVASSARKLDEMHTRMEAIHREALVDSLTALENRRAFDEGLEREVKNAEDAHKPLCVLMCDVDRFKAFNDTWGHATGDQVLRLVASVLKANVKGRDLAARYGGEEFAVILPQTVLSDAVTVAEQIRASIESKQIVKKSTGESLGGVTISIGVAQHLSGEPVEEMLSRADAHLYEAKDWGRNRVCWMLRPDDGRGADAKPSRAGATARSAASKPTIELQFDDQETPIIVDAELNLSDARLIKLHQWWAALPSNNGMPVWRDSLLEQIAFIRDDAHLHEVDPVLGKLLVRFTGAHVARALGADLTGQRFDLAESTGPQQLRPTLARVFEAVNLTRHVRAPLRTYAKAHHRLPTGTYTGEGLWLPFQGKSRELVLGATIFAPVGGLAQANSAA